MRFQHLHFAYVVYYLRCFSRNNLFFSYYYFYKGKSEVSDWNAYLSYHFNNAVLIVLIQYLRCHYKDRLDILACFSRSLNKEWYFVLMLKFLSLLNRHFSVLVSVLLIANEDDYYFGLTLLQHFC